MENIISQAFVTHHAALRGFLTSMTHNATAAEDLAQEAFARLAAEVRAGRTPDNTRAWLFQVARNLVISDVRRRRTADRHIHFLNDGPAQSAEDELLVAEQRAELRSILAQLDPVDRTSLVMAALGYSGAEIGRALGRNESAVRTRLCRVRHRLRLQLQGYA